MIPRYSRTEMARIWEPETRFRIWLRIETYAAEAMAKLGTIPKKAAEAVQRRAFEFVPIIPTGQFILPTAFRANISGLIIAPINLLWNVEKK